MGGLGSLAADSFCGTLWSILEHLGDAASGTWTWATQLFDSKASEPPEELVGSSK